MSHNDNRRNRSTMSLKDAAIKLLAEKGPMHYEAITEEILSRGMASSTSKTPSASLNAVIAVDIQQHGAASPFVRIRPGIFGVRDTRSTRADEGNEGGASRASAEGEREPDRVVDQSEQRVRTPLFPIFSEVRHLLRIWPGWPRRQITGFQGTVTELRGTPQATVDWSDPDQWIPERLKGSDRELAEAIWSRSQKNVNPRHTYGHWLLVQKYELVDEGADGQIALTERGLDFLENEGGDAETFLDEQEGLAKLLALVADNGPTSPGGLLPLWTEYLKLHSAFGSPTTVKDTLRRRLRNLLDRGLVNRTGRMYSVTEAGLAYLKRVGTEEALGGDEQQELWALVRHQEAAVRETLQDLLLNMDPSAFEHLIKRLLEEMDYRNVEVTARSNDGGVDVVGDIEVGITSVREVVQVKRHRNTIQRKDLDALRGSLYRFNAVRGTIITTSQFSKGTQDEAFATGVAPITLIDGAKLIELLIEHGIGVRKKAVEILAVDPESLRD